MPTQLRPLLAGALLALGLSLVAPGAALATGTGGTGGTGNGGAGNGGSGNGPDGPGTSTCPSTTVQESTRAARAVFAGRVNGSRRTDPADGVAGESFSQQVEVTRVYQGELAGDAVDVLTDRQPQQCSQGRLLVGTDYVFFVQGDGTAEDPWVAVGGSGTDVASARLVAQVERLLGEGDEPVAPSEETAEFTPVQLEAPEPLTRLAAPGAALVLIGLLGLLVVGRLGRRAR